MSPHRPAPHRAVLVLSALGAVGSGAFTACAAGNEEELGQNGPATSSSSSSGAGGSNTTSSATGGEGGGEAGAGQGGGVGGEGGAATGGAGGGQGGSGGTASGGGGQGGAGGQAATGTVLLVATGGGDVFTGELHPPASWTTSTLADASGKAPALAFDAAGGALALIRSQANAGELRYASWAAGTWSPFAAVAAGVTTQSRPALAVFGASLGAIFHGDDFKHYFGAFQGGAWAPTAEPVGSPQSFGPSAPSMAAQGPDVIAVFAGNDGDLYDQTRSGGVWLSATGHGLGNLVQLPPAVVSMTAGIDLLVVFVRSTDGKIEWTSRTGAVWTAPSELDINSFSADPVALAALPGGDAVAAFRGLDGNIYTSRYTNGAAPPWSVPAAVANPNYAIASSPSLAPGVGGADAELAFVDTATAQAFHARLQGATWSAPAAVGGSNLVSATIASAP